MPNWIKMRIDLMDDPRVIEIAEILEQDTDFLLWATGQNAQPFTNLLRDISVTQFVTCSLVVTGLLRVWGTARMQGTVTGDDIVLTHATIQTLTKLANVPGFGPALEKVGWAKQLENRQILFPKCVCHMTSPEERKRLQATGRKRKQRDKQRDNPRDASRNGHGDVTPREEKRNNKNNKENLSQMARQVFEYWQISFNHPTAVFGDDRQKKVIGRLKDGYTVEALKQAVDGCKASPYHMGQNKENTKYDDLELICRDSKHVDQFRFGANGQTRPERRAVIPG